MRRFPVQFLGLVVELRVRVALRGERIVVDGLDIVQVAEGRFPDVSTLLISRQRRLRDGVGGLERGVILVEVINALEVLLESASGLIIELEAGLLRRRLGLFAG